MQNNNSSSSSSSSSSASYIDPYPYNLTLDQLVKVFSEGTLEVLQQEKERGTFDSLTYKPFASILETDPPVARTKYRRAEDIALWSTMFPSRNCCSP